MFEILDIINPRRRRERRHDKHAGITQKRSRHWPYVERHFIKVNPQCAACGGKKKLNVHHKKPFHLYSELELDPKNLITLCMDKKKCHIRIGHGNNFKAYNPTVEPDARKALHQPQLFEEVAAAAKNKRLLT